MTVTHLRGRSGTRRMPRSNAPHPEESLAGYLLNLSYRLDYKPSELIHRTGLKTANSASLLDISYAATLPDQARSNFATATGLTENEVLNLTTQRYGDRLTVMTDTRKAARTLAAKQWLPLGRTRYCPQCLAAASADQPDHCLWRTNWITGWALACVEHAALLNDTCPACHTPIGEPGRGTRSLIPHITRTVTHPAACRAAHTATRDLTCGNRLDRAPLQAAHPDLLQLQEWLNAVLAGASSGSQTLGTPCTPTEWLGDLRLTAILIQVSRDTTVLEDVPYGESAAQLVRERVPNRKAGDTGNRTITRAPEDTRAAAGLLLAADRLLSDPDAFERLETLSEKAGQQEREMWKRTRSDSLCSDALHTALRPAKYMISDPRKNRIHAATDLDFGPEHVPSYLDAETFARHFGDITARRFERPLRRFVPIALTRLVSDLSANDAGRLLGYGDNLVHSSSARASDAFDAIGHHELRRRIAAIAEEHQAEPQINYKRRREWFGAHGTLPDTEWQQLESTLRSLKHVRKSTDWKERRTLYEAWVWSLLTQGDLNLAPTIQIDLHGRACMGDASRHFYHLTRRSSHRATVIEFAQRLASTIDSG